jgi:DNA mismatch endonuclease (patch repair protein)
MVDIVSPSNRSRMMAGIQAKNTKPELIVRRMLFAAGYRYRLHRRDLPGAPDIVISRRNVVVFVHGCFWHLHQGCRFAKMPATRPEFWKAKLEANAARDIRAAGELQALGWRVLWVWECATRAPATASCLQAATVEWIESELEFGEIGGSVTRPDNTPH